MEVHGQFADGLALLLDNLPEGGRPRILIQTMVQKRQNIYQLGQMCLLNDRTGQSGWLEGQRSPPSSSQKH